MILSVDVGGTFTDFVVINGGIRHFKVSSTPGRPDEAVARGAQGLHMDGEVFHGSTFGLNAFLEGKGARTAFITNRGFEDLLFIGRQTRPHLYTLHIDRPRPHPGDCHGIPCRMDEHGNELEPLDEEEVHRVARELKTKNISAAVCLLHSYKNPAHEKRIGDILGEYGVEHSLSHRVSREFREYERAMTTFLDAYLSPITRRYMQRVTRVFGREPLIMKSGGGLERASVVNPVDTLFSGPAGGVIGGVHVAQLSGHEDLITFDMGGTSADMASIIDGEAMWKDEGQVEGFPIQTKMLDIVSIGAGGGSIAWVDEGGALRVGPRSAGARPGPACYDRGGSKPTVTDALLQLGYIDQSYFLGGEMNLDTHAAEKAMEELADRIGLTTDEAALGVYRVANSRMARTMKRITMERGLAPEGFAILAFGGAGPLHAAALARELGVKKVLVPPLPGVFSALGMATGDIVRDYSTTTLISLSDHEGIQDIIERLRGEVDLEGEERVLLGLRYQGQSHHLNIPLSPEIEDVFHREHEQAYGYANRDAPVKAVRIHIEVGRRREPVDIALPGGDKAEPSTKECLFPEGRLEAHVYRRDNLPLGYEAGGPAIVADRSSTCLVPPDWRFRVDKYGLLHLEAIG